MEDIAREAGIGRKSLYRYFSSKAELVWGGMEPVIEASGRGPGFGPRCRRRRRRHPGGAARGGRRRGCCPAGPRSHARPAAADRRTPRAGQPELRVPGAAARADPGVPGVRRASARTSLGICVCSPSRRSCPTRARAIQRLDDAMLLECLEAMRDLDALLIVHAENNELLQAGLARMAAAGRVDPLAHAESRPPVVEIEAIRIAVDLAAHVGARLHVAHVSTPAGARIVVAARAAGAAVTCETCPQYLLFDLADLERLGRMPVRACDPLTGRRRRVVDIRPRRHVCGRRFRSFAVPSRGEGSRRGEHLQGGARPEHHPGDAAGRCSTRAVTGAACHSSASRSCRPAGPRRSSASIRPRAASASAPTPTWPCGTSTANGRCPASSCSAGTHGRRSRAGASGTGRGDDSARRARVPRRCRLWSSRVGALPDRGGAGRAAHTRVSSFESRRTNVGQANQAHGRRGQGRRCRRRRLRAPPRRQRAAPHGMAGGKVEGGAFRLRRGRDPAVRVDRPRGALRQHIARYGEGVQHICLEVEDIGQAIEEAIADGRDAQGVPRLPSGRLASAQRGLGRPSTARPSRASRSSSCGSTRMVSVRPIRRLACDRARGASRGRGRSPGSWWRWPPRRAGGDRGGSAWGDDEDRLLPGGGRGG